MKGELTVVFKLKPLYNNMRWEDTEPIGHLDVTNEEQAEVIAHALSGLWKAECRWNWSWSNQGHYVIHKDTLDLYFRDRRERDEQRGDVA